MSKKEKQQQQAPEPKEKKTLDGQYPGLSNLSWLIGYLEQLLAIISEPLLIGCAALAVVDFITGGRLLFIPFLSYLWAGSLALAVTACFIVTCRRSIAAFTLNRYGAGIMLAILGLALGVVDWAAVDVQSLQQTLSIQFQPALAQLGLDIVLITHIRAAVAIAMSVVVAVSNHTAVTTAQAPKRRLAFLDEMINKIAPVVISDQSQTAQLSDPAQAWEEQVITQGETKQSARLHVVPVDADVTTIEKVKQALSSNPTCSDRELGRLTDLAPATAKKYRAQIEQAM